MKLHFEPNLDYQRHAIEAVCDLFRGQEICRTEFTVTRDALGLHYLPGMSNDLGIGNRLQLLTDHLEENLRKIQLRNGLPNSGAVTENNLDFTVEMETGTGKTYVYLRSIFELNKRYGFTKFVIVVPSIAIKEGVYKSLQITEEHFKGLYAGVPFDYFIYDSAKLGQVRNFATSSHIQIMVVTIQSLVRKDYAVVYKESEKVGGEKPIDLIRATRPIIVVDEPQSVDGGLEGRGKQALTEMGPLCTLRYSATHVDKHHMVYRLDAVDAYEQKLVKQIEVASAVIESAYNRPYLRLIKPQTKRGTVSAQVEVDVKDGEGVERKVVTVFDGDDLEMVTGRAIYEDCRIGEIRAQKGNEYLELRYSGGEVILRPGEAHGDVDALAVQRQMIRRTIREHLDKEKRLRPLGIKVLSLFFIDEVARYRSYDTAGNPLKGDYARIFEEEYQRAAKLPDYNTLFKEVDLTTAAQGVHNGYFSIDKAIHTPFQDLELKKSSSREDLDTSAYNLIMKEKEKLLSFNTPLKFIFSHSALKEGWDNPNVFQICTLRDIRTERERRQTIGRGLRLCVNQDGQRQRGFELNTLTVVATEHYEEFAENLQKEIERETGIRFGVVEKHQFASVTIKDEEGKDAPLGFDRSETIWDHLRQEGYINAQGKIQDVLKIALKDDTFTLPPEFAEQRATIGYLLQKLAGRLEVKNADERKPVRPRQAILHSPDFKALWDRIKHKTTYRVHFDNEKLVAECISALQKAPPIPRARLQWNKADIAIKDSGVEAKERSGAATVMLDEAYEMLPDVLTDLQDRTQLTRRTLYRILVESRRMDEFKRNPQAFIELASEAINRCKRLAVVDGIKYQRIGDDAYYAQELFEQEELSGYMKNMREATKCIYEQVVYDSTPEAEFADQLERNSAIKLYAKLPGWFQVPTPLGSYNPDWAILVEIEDQERLYFVVETKSELFADEFRDREKAKIICGKAHFESLIMKESRPRYVVARNIGDVFNAV